MSTRIGKCSLCGGDVMGHIGFWPGRFATPPPPTCASCGAVEAAGDHPDIVIQMERPQPQRAHIGETHKGPPRC